MFNTGLVSTLLFQKHPGSAGNADATVKLSVKCHRQGEAACPIMDLASHVAGRSGASRQTHKLWENVFVLLNYRSFPAFV